MASKSNPYDGRRPAGESVRMADRVPGALALLAGAGLARYGARYRTIRGTAIALLGSSLILKRIKSGKLLAGGETVIHQAVTVNKPPDQVREDWRRLDPLPRGMHYLKAVQPTGENASLPDGNSGFGLAPLPTSGRVSFSEPPNGRGTRLDLTVSWRQPLGPLGAAVARLIGRSPEARMEGDLRRVKALLEGGEMPMTSGQPAGERGPIGRLANTWAKSR